MNNKASKLEDGTGTKVKEHPILMSPALVLKTANLEKTETRRMRGLNKINAAPDDYFFSHFLPDDKKGRLIAVFFARITSVIFRDSPIHIPCPYGKPGDVLWIRENWAVSNGYDGVKPMDLFDDVDFNVWYEADGPRPLLAGKLRPSIHMPRWISRYTLKIMSIHVERWKDITPEGAIAEGIDYQKGNGIVMYRHYLKDKWGPNPVHSFETLVKKINGPACWDNNLFCWVIKYQKL